MNSPFLPPPAIPVSSSRFSHPAQNASSSSIGGLEGWLRLQQRKFVKLNMKRASTLNQDIPISLESIPLDHLEQNCGVDGFMDSGPLVRDCLLLLRELLPAWSRYNCGDDAVGIGLRLERVGGAMTNSMFICHPVCVSVKHRDSVQLPPKVLLRLYGQGTEQFFDRKREIYILQVFSCLNVGPALLGMFSNGRFEEYIDSACLTSDTLRQPAISCKIAGKLFELHSMVGFIPAVSKKNDTACSYDDLSTVEKSGPRASDLNDTLFKREYKSELWARLDAWIDNAEHALLKCDTDIYPLERLQKLFDFTALRREVAQWADKVKSVNSPVVFSHNDLQYGNILRKSIITDSSSATVDDEIILIDFEYSGYSYRGFDIANHFCEWTANYHSATPHLLDSDKMPSVGEQERFFEAYLNARDSFVQATQTQGSSHFHPSPTLSPKPSPNASPLLTPEVLKAFRKMELHHMQEEVAVFVPLSHLLWSLWGIVQAEQSVIEFDYLGYAVQRIEAYHKLKQNYIST